jgi:endonuclease III-like uncharacterized protein
MTKFTVYTQLQRQIVVDNYTAKELKDVITIHEKKYGKLMSEKIVAIVNTKMFPSGNMKNPLIMGT